MPMCEVDPETGTADWSNFFGTLAAMFPWYNYGGDENEMNYYITPDIYLSCRQFENARKSHSTTPLARIYLVCNGSEDEIYRCYADAWNAAKREFKVLSGSGGIMLLIGNSPYDWSSEALGTGSNYCIRFAAVHCLDLAEAQLSSGIYVPKSPGSISYDQTTERYSYTGMDATPRYFVTEDTQIMKVQTRANYCFSSSDVHMYVPICGIQSNCISTKAMVSLSGGDIFLGQ